MSFDLSRRNFLFVIFSGLLLLSCASADTIKNANPNDGIPQRFAAGYDETRAATVETIERLNIKVTGSEETENGLEIYFVKSISAFSWGEVGRVIVFSPMAPTTRAQEGEIHVVVTTSKRVRGQVTGTSETKFAQEIFDGIRESLAKYQQ